MISSHLVYHLANAFNLLNGILVIPRYSHINITTLTKLGKVIVAKRIVFVIVHSVECPHSLPLQNTRLKTNISELFLQLLASQVHHLIPLLYLGSHAHPAQAQSLREFQSCSRFQGLDASKANTH